MSSQPLKRRLFTSYAGATLPLRLIDELDAETIDNRITYFAGYFDDRDRLKVLEKIVYGEIEFSHHYEYGPDDRLVKTILLEEDGETIRTLTFDPHGGAIETTSGP